MEGTLGSGTMTWVKVRTSGIVQGQGRITPRVTVPLSLATPNERTRADIRHVRVQLWCCPGHAQELIGETAVIGRPIYPYDATLNLEFATTHRMLQYLTEQLASGTALDLELRWDGLIAVTWDPTDEERRVYGDQPAPGEEVLVPIAATGTPQRIAVSRSDWYSNVLRPTQNQDYVFIEIAVPRGVDNERWTTVNGHLAKADEAFVISDDSAVFHHLRAALDALPGAKTHIFDTLSGHQSKEWDALTKAIGRYLHFGRHVDTDDDKCDCAAGTFPVNHQDAACALDLVKVLLSHISRVLPPTQ
jgi:hypothetical protein